MKESVHVWFLDVVHEALWNALDAAGMKCHDGTGVSREALVAGDIGPVHGLVLRSRIRLDAEVLHAIPDLQWIARSGSGLENIDLATTAKLGIAVHSSPEGNRDAVGEHCVGMLLSTLHKLTSADASIRQHQWLREAHRGRELKFMTVGIVGYGHMGSAFAERLSGFGCRVLAYDKYKDGWGETPSIPRPMKHVQPVGWSAFCRDVDVVSLHLPLTEETEKMVGEDWLDQFDRPILLMNTSRGSILHTSALLSALDQGQVTEACLDVLEFEGHSLEDLEELEDEFLRTTLERLLAHPRVLLSPHVAGWTVESYQKLSTVLADKILAHSSSVP